GLDASGAPADDAMRVAVFGGWRFAESCDRLTAPGGREVGLSAAEAVLLAIMLRRPNRILSRAVLIGDDAGREPLDRSIDARISRLRRKLDAGDGSGEIIKTVYGAGYMLTAKVEWE